ncbi:polyketide synthase, partial [Streptomyces sp. DT24]
MEQAPQTHPHPTPNPLPITPWVLSGRSPAALRDQAVRLRKHLDTLGDWDPVDVGWSLATTRTTFEHRTVVTGANRAELLAGLDRVTETPDTTVVPGGGLGFLFTGQGAQHPGMGAELYAQYPVFAEALDEVFAHFDGLGLREAVF